MSKAKVVDEGERWIDWLSLDELEGAPRNPKGHDDATIDASIGRHGFVEIPTLDERTKLLVAGHGRRDRLRARRAAGEEPPKGVRVGDDGRWLVPVLRGWASLSDSEAEAYVLTSNQATIAGGWDMAEVGRILRDHEDDESWRRGLGFDSRDIKLALSKLDVENYRSSAERTEDDHAHAVGRDENAITQPGDVWRFDDRHRLICGDSTEAETVAKVLDGDPIDLVCTSPPYNVGVVYDAHDDEQVEWPQLREFLSAVIDAFTPHVPKGRAVVWNIGVARQTHPHKQVQMLEDAGYQLHRILTWRKCGTPLPTWHGTETSRRVRVFSPNPITEWCVLVSRGGELERGGELDELDPTWEFDIATINQAASSRQLDNVNGPRTGAQSNLDRRATKEHPAAYPLEIPRPFARMLADVGAVVFDPFSGSGTTILAASQVGRVGVGVELSRAYCDTTARRLMRAGMTATRNGHPVVLDDLPVVSTD